MVFILWVYYFIEYEINENELNFVIVIIFFIKIKFVG